MTHGASETTPLVSHHDTAANHNPIHNPEQYHHHHDHHHHHHHHHHHDDTQQPPLQDHLIHGSTPINNPFLATTRYVNRRHQPCSCDECRNQTSPLPTAQFILLIFFGFILVVGWFVVFSNHSFISLFPFQPTDPRLGHFPPPTYDTSSSYSSSSFSSTINTTISPLSPPCYEDPHTPRHTIIHEVTNPITGHFDLHDLLELTTVTGSIDITITLRPGCNPAVLRLRTSTGSITVRLAVPYLDSIAAANANDSTNTITSHILQTLLRPYQTSVSSQTGSITISYLLGNGGATTISTATGSQTLDLFTVHTGPNDGVTTLDTETITAPQSVSVRAFAFDSGDMDHLVSRHVSRGGGEIDITYGRTWEGKLEVEGWKFGLVDLQGDGLVVDDQDDGGDGIGEGRVRAHRGTGEGEVSILGVSSGVVRFRC